MKEKIRGAIIIISCHKHKETRLKKYMLTKQKYEGYKVFYIFGNPNIKSDYEVKNENFITLNCEDSYLHILKKVILSIKTIMSIYDIEEGILRCGDDLIFHEQNLSLFLNSSKHSDYMGNMDGYGNGNELIKFEDISIRVDQFMPDYFNNHPEDILNPLNGLDYNKNILKSLNIIPNCRYINGVITWLSIKSCNTLIEEILYSGWETCKYSNKHGYPYIIEDVGVGFILAKHNIYPVARKFYVDNDDKDQMFSTDIIAIHTNEFK